MTNVAESPDGLAFLKMHGLGNDFVIIDATGGDDPMTPALAQLIGDRHFGIGFDQLVVIHGPTSTATAVLDFWNSDGSVSDACGNATRCVARLLMDKTGLSKITLHTGRGDLSCEDAGEGMVRVNMGHPQTEWQDIPLAKSMDTVNLPIKGSPAATGMGNPHCSFFVDNLALIDIDSLGPEIENHPLFPERTNVQAVQVLGPNKLRIRVWERGAGHTLASGSSSCAVVVAGVRKGLVGRKTDVQLEGGILNIDWRDDGVWMTGPTMMVASGILSSEFLADAR